VLQFSLELNIDVAEQEVQASINAAQTYLPADLPVPPIYSKTNPADSPILTLALTSQTIPLSQVEDLADTRLSQKIAQLPGVGAVSISGGQKPAIRIQVNPAALSAYGINLEDVRSALQQTSLNIAKGSFDGAQQGYQIDANDQLLTSKDFRQVVVAYRNGGPIMLSDVANILDDTENSKLAAWMNTTPAVIMNVQRQPGANIIARFGAAHHPNRPHHHDPRFGARRSVRIDAHRGLGGDGDLSFSAQCFRHHHSERGGATFAGRHVRGDVFVRLQPE
jgi:multidrug efflux pump